MEYQLQQPLDRERAANKCALSWPIIAVYVLLGYVTASNYLSYAHECGAGAPSMRALCDFVADRPYQYRILFLLIARALCPMLHCEPYRLLASTSALCIIVLPFTFRRLLSLFMAPTPATLLAPIILYPVYWHYCYSLISALFMPYDMPAILFFVIGLELIFKAEWTKLNWLLLVASLNRETSIFLIVATALLWWRLMPAKAMIRTLAIQLALWTLVHSCVAIAFRHNGGHTFDLMCEENFLNIVSATFGEGDLYHRIGWLGGGLWPFLFLFGESIPAQVRSLRWLVPIFFAGMFCVGLLAEMRIYNELIPIIALFAAIAIEKSMRRFPTSTSGCP